MIRVNLVGTGRKKSAGLGLKVSLPSNVMPIVLLLIVLGTAGGGYWWYTSLNAQDADLTKKKAAAEKQKADLDVVIKADQVYQARKKALENRVRVIEGLTRNQLSPVIALDQLAEAVNRTQYVWLSSLDQKDAILSMTATGTSLNAIADFYSNLSATGYFKNVDQGPAAADGQGNWSFTIKCEFSPPRSAPPVATPPPAAGGN
jgi:Tfp pilus assembly protein PilN